MISVIIIAKNEEDRIKTCLESVQWADEIIVTDNGSTDKTLEIAKKYTDKIVEFKEQDFATLRNLAAEKAMGDWILYVDADERVSTDLKNEILKIIAKAKSSYGCFVIPRENFILGRLMKHGGWWPDYVKRLFYRKNLERWEGKLHEEPVYKGKLGYLKNPLTHIKHDKLSEMVEKTNIWSEVEAKLLLEAGHPKMVWWRFIRVMITELFYRLIVLRGFMDGGEGVIYSFYQMYSKFVTYAKLWEMQIKKRR